MRAALLAPMLALALASSAPASEPPNIVVILADDQGFGGLSATGATQIATPSIDRICAEGMQFTSFYVHNRCSPTRLAFMTGSDANRAGYDKVIYQWSLIGINDEEITTAELLQEAGYATGMVGKWHLGEWEQFNPVHHGFDSFFGFMKSEDQSEALFRDTQLVEKIKSKTDGIHSEKLLQAGLEFLESHQDQPFFLYYASPIPHVKWKPHPRFEGSSELGAYGDVMQELDWQVGALLDKLDELGLTENTLVIYTTDNGPQLGIGGEESSGIFRDGKWTNFEGGIRVPCFLRWPAKITAGTSNDEITAIYDLLPTFCELAGVELPADLVIDGKSLVPYLRGESPEEPIHDSFLVPGSTIRQGDWKLLTKSMTPGGQERYWGERIPAEAGSLFDLRSDPGETTDVSAQHSDIVTALTQRLEEETKNMLENAREIGKTPDYSEERVDEWKNRKKGK